MRWKVKTEKDWHAHFALWPVKVEGEWVWLERVMRKGWKRSASLSSKKGGWTWDYVNSEFDLIRRAEAERSMQESNVGQMAQGAKAASYNMSKGSGLTVTGNMNMNTHAILQQIKSTQS